MALSPRATRALAALGVAALAALLFWPARRHAWLNYDDVYIVANPAMALGLSREGIVWAFTSLHSANWFPLT